MNPSRTLVLSLALLGAPVLAHAQGGGGRRGEARRDSIMLDRLVAIVGKKAITLSELYQVINEERASREMDPRAPRLPTDTIVLKKQFLDDMIDTELLLQKADALKLSVTDEEMAPAVDKQIDEARKQFKTEAEYLAALRAEGFSSTADLRRRFLDQERRRQLQRKTIDTLTQLGKMPKVSVSEKEIQATYDSLVARSKPPGPKVTFRQIIINPVPSDSADARARKLADSLLVALKAGANFDSLARKFSNDSSNYLQGGVLPPFRRDAMVAAFSQAAFATPVGELSPVIKTRYGYHVIRVDRARPGEVTARHILITPVRNASDVARTRLLADSVAAALRAGASYDSLAQKYHDTDGGEDRLLPNLFADSLPGIYKAAMDGLKPRDISPAFEIPNPMGAVPKVGIVQLLARNESGIPTLAERREQIRDNLQKAASWRHLLDTLRRETYVSIRL